MSKPNILFVLTSHKSLGDTGKNTGWYLPEFAHPYHVLEPVANITVCSLHGGEAPLDEESYEAFKDEPISKEFFATKQHLWKKTPALTDFLGKAGDFDAVIVPGGHGPMFDLATSPASRQLIQEFADAGKVVAAVCHGPAAFVNVTLKDGKHLLEGAEVTGFSNAEEDAMQLSSVMPFMLETEMAKNAAKYEKAPELWGEKVVVSKGGKLITGQNPASATAFGEAIKKQLGV